MKQQPSTRPKTDYTKPIPWVIVVDAMSYEKAQEVGKALGECGVTGLFMTGTQADNLKEFADLKRKMIEKGGDVNAEKDAGAVDSALL